jgi:hypothetical protein
MLALVPRHTSVKLKYHEASSVHGIDTSSIALGLRFPLSFIDDIKTSQDSLHLRETRVKGLIPSFPLHIFFAGGRPNVLHVWVDGYPARVVQHENDHLDGVMMEDRVKASGGEYMTRVHFTIVMHKYHVLIFQSRMHLRRIIPINFFFFFLAIDLYQDIHTNTFEFFFII